MYGINDPRLNEEPLPYYAVGLWNAFWQLHSARQVTQQGIFQPITFIEIDAFSRLMQCDLEPWEIEVLKRMDRAFLLTINTKTENNNG